MGMDVIGKNPASETGEYFRNNVWAWRPLWNYCSEVAPDLLASINGHYNDGEGLNSRSARDLAERLDTEVTSGRTAVYEQAYNDRLATLPRHDCEWCGGTGIRDDKVGVENGFPTRELSVEVAAIVGRTTGWCNGCHGEGLCDHPDTSYGFWTDNVVQFAAFLRDCGGFEIW